MIKIFSRKNSFRTFLKECKKGKRCIAFLSQKRIDSLRKRA